MYAVDMSTLRAIKKENLGFSNFTPLTKSVFILRHLQVSVKLIAVFILRGRPCCHRSSTRINSQQLVFCRFPVLSCWDKFTSAFFAFISLFSANEARFHIFLATAFLAIQYHQLLWWYYIILWLISKRPPLVRQTRKPGIFRSRYIPNTDCSYNLARRAASYPLSGRGI